MVIKTMFHKIKKSERCWLCHVTLSDINRAGTTLEPMCKRCELRVNFVGEFMARGGTKVDLQELTDKTPDFLNDYMRMP